MTISFRLSAFAGQISLHFGKGPPNIKEKPPAGVSVSIASDTDLNPTPRSRRSSTKAISDHSERAKQSSL